MKILYDSSCNLCKLFKLALTLLDYKRSIKFFPLNYGKDIEKEILSSSFHLILKDNSVLSGREAIPKLIEYLLPFLRLPNPILELFKEFYDGLSKIKIKSKCGKDG
ncbi:MAG: DCC1-like thiol-disulfide oxidoreductase family protein [Nitrososphaerales archaeon]